MCRLRAPLARAWGSKGNFCVTVVDWKGLEATWFILQEELGLGAFAGLL